MEQVRSCAIGVIRCMNESRILRSLRCMLLVVLLSSPGVVLAMDYGETGPYSVNRETIQNPLSGDDVTVFLPKNVQTRVPVMFFSHGYNADYYQAYKSMCTHVASQGFAVVYSPYPSAGGWSEQYDIMWRGFLQAADVYENSLDLNYVGFFGHSWGGGAVPNMALRGIDRGWGKSGLLMFIMAPGRANGVNKYQLQSLDNGHLIVQSFENDDIVPESLALKMFENIGIPSVDKAYYYVWGGEHADPTERSVDNYDSLAIWAPLDALMDYTFNQNYNGRVYALDGQGDHWSTTIVQYEVEETPDERTWTSWRDALNQPGTRYFTLWGLMQR